MSQFFLGLFFVFALMSFAYLFKKTTRFNKKCSIILMSLSVVSFLLHDLISYQMSFSKFYFFFQNTLLGAFLLYKTIPFLFQREKGDDDEDI